MVLDAGAEFFLQNNVNNPATATEIAIFNI